MVTRREPCWLAIRHLGDLAGHTTSKDLRLLALDHTDL